ncbi:MAG: nucleoside deaminase [Proteobacteria bacterium]|nr:nucleoside deaminase [Pseudomonadota bacterium]MBU1737734.1 nucleoside deaminase [Pseudomonadota bacterium]
MNNDDHTHMLAALDEARGALAAGEFPVGCVMVHQGRIVATGRRVNSCGPAANELDHAEIVALRSLFADAKNAAKIPETTVYSTMEPCLMCFATLLLNGVRRIVYAFEDVMGGGTDLELASLNPLYRAMEVEIVTGICRAESLDLFRSFFRNGKNAYWQDSLLARHILAQD